MRAVTFQPAPASLRVTEIAITGSPEPASSRMVLARKRPSFSSTPMIARRPALGEQPALGGEIAAEAAVAVEVVGERLRKTAMSGCRARASSIW